jgi:hypothetical protein
VSFCKHTCDTEIGCLSFFFLFLLFLSFFPLVQIDFCVLPGRVSYEIAIMSGNWQPQVPVEEINGGPIEGGPNRLKGSKDTSNEGVRKKIVVVGLGMVGISFMCVLPICQ